MTGIRLRVLCILVALALAFAGATVAIDVVAVGTGHSPVVWPQQSIAADLGDSRWGDTAIMAVAAAVALIGLLLVRVALSRGRRHAVPLESDDEHIRTTTTRSSLRHSLGDAVEHIEGVDKHRVRLRRRRVKIKVFTPLRDSDPVRALIATTADERLSAFRTAHPYKVTVKVRTAKGLR